MPTVGVRAVDGVDDTHLVERILADPTAGWATAWERYGHQIHSFCFRMLDDPADADDAVADVFLVAAQRIDQLRNPDAFRAWLYAIARRRIQRRWRDRDRTTPVDPHGESVMNAATDDLGASGASDAAELLAAASGGLNDRDRELLALTLGADLDTTEVARITGESTNAVSVRVTRLKDTVGRAAGALLVARHHRRDCDVLDGILAQWDGTFDTVWRKRIARHIDGCDDCTRRRATAAAVFAAPMLLAPPTDALRDRVLQPISGRRPVAAPDLGPWDDDGFPAGDARRRQLPWWAAVAVGVVILFAVVVAIVTGSDGGGESLATVGDSPIAGDTGDETINPTTTSTTTTSTTAPDVAAPPTTAATPPPTTQPSVIPAPTTTPAPAAPTVTVTLSPGSITANGEQTTDATVGVTAVGGASTTVSWNGPESGAVVVSGPGTHTVTIGPFSSGAATVTVTATTEAAGGTATDTAVLTVYPEPG